MKSIFVFISVLFTLTSSAQSLSKIKQLLLAKDPIAFENYVDSILRYSRPKAETYVWMRSYLKRDICPSFHETIVDLDEIVYWKDTVTKGGYYRVKLIATKSQFVYCNFEKQISKDVNNNPVYETIDSFRNAGLVDSLEISFLHNYRTKLNWKELFISTNIYGRWCGIAGSSPKMRIELDTIVKKGDIQLLTSWLKSPNAEKQVYAIDGLYQLKRKGYKLTEEQQRLIGIIKNKKGKIKECGGCLYDDTYINPVVNAIIAGKDI